MPSITRYQAFWEVHDEAVSRGIVPDENMCEFFAALAEEVKDVVDMANRYKAVAEAFKDQLDAGRP